MQFLLFDVSATVAFLTGYLAIVALQRRRAFSVMAVSGSEPRGAPPPAPARDEREPARTQKERPATQCCQEWPRLSAPR